ncbi:MAG: VOC family protein [Deltaproteobacteria bacterium]|nr:VOC family protein [Deltaproteobacteria bacterium]
MTKPKESLGIQRVASLHVFVRDLERSRDHYVNNLDFAEIAVSSPEFEIEQRARASVVQAGGARLVFMEPLGSKGESFRWLEKHPEGVGRVVFDVEDAERAFALLTARGATPTTGIELRNVEGGAVLWFDIATVFGDTLFRFVQHTGQTPIMPDLVRLDPARGGSNRFGIGEVDHITSNFLTLKPAIMWMEEVMGLERLWDIEFHTQDVKKGHFGGSGLKSIVMWDPASGIKFANNEPLAPSFKSSQIYLFCEDHRGPGIQHVALAVRDIIAAVGGLREMGVKFMPIPGAYYEMMPERLRSIGMDRLDEDLNTLQKLEILFDGSAPNQYLLQIFMREAAALFADPQAGPLFIELIQRKGDRGFGGGNFRALFESIERQQQAEGRA